MSVVDWFARATWDDRNLTEMTRLWTDFIRESPIAHACPKVEVAFFYYPSLHTTIRGARAREPIHVGERLCTIPEHELFSEYTVGNSSISAIFSRSLPESHDYRTGFALYALREVARKRAQRMPYLRLIETHDVRIPFCDKPSHRVERDSSPVPAAGERNSYAVATRLATLAESR